MGRHSKLTDKQWVVISDRILDGEPTRALAREYGVAESTIRERFSAQHKNIRQVANQLATADMALKALPPLDRITAQDLADALKAITLNLTSAARFGSATASKLAGEAHGAAIRFNFDNMDGEGMQTLKSIAALTRVANEASEIGFNLIKNNKDATPQEEPIQLNIIRAVKKLN